MEFSNNINAISLGKVFWGEFKENRISFTFRGLPEGTHFTLAWNTKTGDANLHLTRNTGDGTNKPKFVIANFDKYFLEDLMKFMPVVLFRQIFEPINFRKYSRKSRKNIRLIYTDNLQDKENDPLENKMIDVWKRISTVKRHKLKIHDDFEKAFPLLIRSRQTQLLLENRIRRLTSHSFDYGKTKSGIVIIGRRSYPFISCSGSCFVVTQKLTPYELFAAFVEPAFAQAMLEYINEALMRLSDATCYEDTLPFNRPFVLRVLKCS